MRWEGKWFLPWVVNYMSTYTWLHPGGPWRLMCTFTAFHASCVMFSFVRKRPLGTSKETAFLALEIGPMVGSFTFQLDWPTGCPGIWLDIFPGCVCKGVSGIWIGRLRKTDCPPQCSSSIQPIEVPSRTKRWGKVEFPVCLTAWDVTLVSWPRVTGFPGLQSANCGTC